MIHCSNSVTECLNAQSGRVTVCDVSDICSYVTVCDTAYVIVCRPQYLISHISQGFLWLCGSKFSECSIAQLSECSMAQSSQNGCLLEHMTVCGSVLCTVYSLYSVLFSKVGYSIVYCSNCALQYYVLLFQDDISIIHSSVVIVRN